MAAALGMVIIRRLKHMATIILLLAIINHRHLHLLATMSAPVATMGSIIAALVCKGMAQVTMDMVSRPFHLHQEAQIRAKPCSLHRLCLRSNSRAMDKIIS